MMNKAYIIVILLSVTLIGCKNEEQPVRIETEKRTVEDNYIVVEDFKDTMIHPREEITTIEDRYGRSREPEAAVTLEFMTKGRRAAWCAFQPVDDHPLLKPILYPQISFELEDDELRQILAIRMQIVDEELFIEKSQRDTSSSYNVLLANTEYYCAYIDYAGNQYLAKFKVPSFEPVKYHKYILKGKLVKDLALYNKHFMPNDSYTKKLIK